MSNLTTWNYKGLVIEMSDNHRSYNAYDLTTVFGLKQIVCGGAGEDPIYTKEYIEKAIDNLYDENIKEATSKMNDAYGRYMYEECAERGYDHNASRAAFSEYCKYKDIVEKLTKIHKGEDNE